MTAAHRGDRVRVTFEGTVERVLPSTGRYVVKYDVDGAPAGYRSSIVPPDSVEKLVTIGDVVTTDAELDALPVGAVVVPTDCKYAVGAKTSDGWQLANDLRAQVAPHLPATVVALRGGE